MLIDEGLDILRWIYYDSAMVDRKQEMNSIKVESNSRPTQSLRRNVPIFSSQLCIFFKPK